MNTTTTNANNINDKVGLMIIIITYTPTTVNKFLITLTITFVNTGADQSADLGKTIAGTLEVAQTAK